MIRTIFAFALLLAQSALASTPHPTDPRVTFSSGNVNRTILFCAIDPDTSVCKIPTQEETLILTKQDVGAAFGDGRVFFFNDQEALSGCKWIAEKRYTTRRITSVEITRKPSIKGARRNQFSCLIKWSSITPAEYAKTHGYNKTHSTVFVSYNERKQYAMMEVEK